MASIDRVSVSEDINDPSPPCLRFHLAFTINAPGQVPHDGKYDVCFNGEFYQNLGIRMLRVAYPKINKMYKALEEAELRYAKIAGIKKSLDRVMKDIKKNVRVGMIFYSMINSLSSNSNSNSKTSSSEKILPHSPPKIL